MVELLAVITIIGVLAAASAPSILRVLRDRRVNQVALQQADMYRVARSRAMGRGSAVLVRWDHDIPTPTPSTPAGRLTMREAVLGGTDPNAMLPTASCHTPDWTDGSTDSKYVAAFDDRRNVYEWAAAQMLDPDGDPANHVEICYTPRGRTFVREDPSAGFTPLTGVYRLEVTNTETLLVRQVIIPPNGVARIETRVAAP
jgi:type IV fimbrial biogenesis protein FimT